MTMEYKIARNGLPLTSANRVIIDLDGTLCDHRHRVAAALLGVWDEYHDGISDDPVHEDVRAVIQSLWDSGYDIIACTGRPEAYMGKTMEWLGRNEIPIDAVVMRPDKDFRPDHQLKPEALARYLELEGPSELADFGNILLVIDDREKVVEAWRNLGLNCWQPRLGDV